MGLEKENKYIGTKEAAELLGFSQSTVSRLCREGKIKGAEQDAKGSPWRIPLESVMEMINKENKI